MTTEYFLRRGLAEPNKAGGGEKSKKPFFLACPWPGGRFVSCRSACAVIAAVVSALFRTPLSTGRLPQHASNALSHTLRKGL